MPSDWNEGSCRRRGKRKEHAGRTEMGLEASEHLAGPLPKPVGLGNPTRLFPREDKDPET